ncbi:S8 family serine peptidase [Nocardioides sp. TRM66260-LWL]|uniref:S8 family serine peptidase n=1 Tax=Nocardioides sp. TRM66260-LWL TaxID=2874478 RepID=UPI001CC66346|nr:S8 family serine peptidase [Nocardioides sp. TRM66260-LWL]MBZ5735973.1 S8 family serine peptidase [Nocardioides sp. TRM66260-LWL]
MLVTALATGLGGLAVGASGSQAADAPTGSGAAAGAAAGPTSGPLTAGRYVVVLRQPGAAAYKGGTAGLAPTSPSTTGLPFSPRAATTQRYTTLLRSQQSSLADEYGVRPEQRFTIGLNGFSARLSGAQATSLSRDKRVLMVAPDRLLKPQGYRTTPDTLGLTGGRGVWQRTGGVRRAGSGVVVAMIDSGIWPEAPSFAGTRLTSKPQGPWDASQSGTTTRMEKRDGGLFTGECQAGPEFPSTTCSTKIVSARAYSKGYLEAIGGADKLSDTEFLSARDGSGHGSHTASTAAGDSGVSTRLAGTTYKDLSGMAPAASIAVYKVCWSAKNPDDDACTTSDSLAAIDDVIADGADVINYSIGGPASPELNPTDVAFEAAAEAGVFVAASAGNSGPGATTLDNASPWITTVGAATSYAVENTAVLGDRTRLAGVSRASKAVPRSPLVDSTAVAAAGVKREDAALCGPGTLSNVKAKGTIVVCRRGVVDRVAKSAEVKRAGGVGMLLINVSKATDDLEPDLHTVPTVHLDVADGEKVLAYLAKAGTKATAEIRLGNLVGRTAVPQIADFSSRGATEVAEGDVLKPDIAAPGVGVLAAVAPPSNEGRAYDFYDGTSMASPHIAGLAALLMGVHPTWGPMAVKSAMMTTARPLRTPGGFPSDDVFAHGAGEVSPASMLDPGLLVVSRPTEWRGFLAQQGYPTGARPIDANEINTPAFAEGEGTGPIVFTRTFSAQRAGTWDVSSRVRGFSLRTSPTRIVSKRKGDLVTVRFTFTRTTARLGQYARGYVSLTGPTALRLPVALRPVSVAAPRGVSGTSDATGAGSTTVDVTPGVTGDLALDVAGFARADTTTASVAEGKSAVTCLTVPAGARLARLDLAATDADADLDLAVYAAPSCDATPTALVGQSAGPTGDERVDLLAPDAGTYLVEVAGYAAGASGSPIPYRLDQYVVDGTSTQGGLAATPNPLPVTTGTPTSYDLTWSGLTPGRYLGLVDYEGAVSPTIVATEVSAAP